jgi:ATP/maltotriose-dependent transcriptional regulator MalT
MAYSNMSQLMMLKGKSMVCLQWGHKAVELANTLGDQEVLCHGYDNIGVALLRDPDAAGKGEQKLRESLRIALTHEFHEHAARAYNNLGYGLLELRRQEDAEQVLRQGIAYCDERDLHSWMNYLQSSLAAVYLDTGRWDDAVRLCTQLLHNPSQQSTVRISLQSILYTIQIRTGEASVNEDFQGAASEAMRIGELQRLATVVRALLEHKWLIGKSFGKDDIILNLFSSLVNVQNPWLLAGLSYWNWKAKGALPEEVKLTTSANGSGKNVAIELLHQIKSGNPYLEALWLTELDDTSQRKGLRELMDLGAHAAARRVETEMREKGILNIPRGPRSSTVKNPAGLKKRQMDVLKLLSEGLQNKEIAGALFVSAKTIDHHISTILSKLDVHSRAKAVAKAKEMGILK